MKALQNLLSGDHAIEACREELSFHSISDGIRHIRAAVATQMLNDKDERVTT